MQQQSGRVALLGVPVDLGAAQRGTLMGPAALRTAGRCWSHLALWSKTTAT